MVAPVAAAAAGQVKEGAGLEVVLAAATAVAEEGGLAEVWEVPKVATAVGVAVVAEVKAVVVLVVVVREVEGMVVVEMAGEGMVVAEKVEAAMVEVTEEEVREAAAWQVGCLAVMEVVKAIPVKYNIIPTGIHIQSV